MSSAEEIANQFESGELEVGAKDGGKRTKAEQVEHKHAHPEGDTRKIVKNAMEGEEKRKQQEKDKDRKAAK